MADFIDLTLHVIIGFITLLMAVRLIGNKQLGQVNVFTYISGMVIGSMIADTVLHDNVPLFRTVRAIAIWTFLLYLFEMISLKNVYARKILDGQPTIVIKNGQIMYEALKKERMNLNDLTMMLRTNQTFNISEVAYAICEPNGDLSVLKKHEKDQATREDFKQLSTTTHQLPTSIIIDGKLIEENLQNHHPSVDAIMTRIHKLDHLQISSVFYGEIQSDGNLFIQSKTGKTYLTEI